MIAVGSCYNEMIIENIQLLDFNRWAFFIQVSIWYQKIVASVPNFQTFSWILCSFTVFKYQVYLLYFEVSTTEIRFFGISYVPLAEVTVQNFRFLFLIETDLKGFSRYYYKLRLRNKATVVKHYRSVIHNNHEIM